MSSKKDQIRKRHNESITSRLQTLKEWIKAKLESIKNRFSRKDKKQGLPRSVHIKHSPSSASGHSEKPHEDHSSSSSPKLHDEPSHVDHSSSSSPKLHDEPAHVDHTPPIKHPLPKVVDPNEEKRSTFEGDLEAAQKYISYLRPLLAIKRGQLDELRKQDPPDENKIASKMRFIETNEKKLEETLASISINEAALKALSAGGRKSRCIKNRRKKKQQSRRFKR